MDTVSGAAALPRSDGTPSGRVGKKRRGKATISCGAAMRSPNLSPDELQSAGHSLLSQRKQEETKNFVSLSARFWGIKVASSTPGPIIDRA